MRIIITGGTGLIGWPLAQSLACRGHEVVVLSRDPALAARTFQQPGVPSIRLVGWDGRTAEGWAELLGPQTAIVNLAGATPAHWRWTRAYRARILQSRLLAGQAVMEAMARYGPPNVLIQASASGYYGDRGEDVLSEASPPGRGFRSKVCQAWEASTAGAPTRRCVLRTGIVLDTRGGAFPSLLRFACLFGRCLGSGRQWVPWITNADVTDAIRLLIERSNLSGPFNLCAPASATHENLMRAVRRLLHRPGLFTLPTWTLRLALGGLSSVVLDSQRMTPHRLLATGFQFTYPHLDAALCHLLLGESPTRAPDLA
jgi:uncharacterized protein (TIGR01777 family)